MKHPTAIVWGKSVIGEGTVLGPNVIVGHPGKDEGAVLRTGAYDTLDGARIGKNCTLRAGGILYSRATFGDNVVTGHNFLVREDTKVGDGTLVGSGTIIDNAVTIGRKCSIQTGVYIPTYTKIGDGVFLGPRACITNDKKMGRADWKLEGVVIEDFARVGANCTILPGVRIGRDAVVGGGAVVTKDVAPRTIVAGCPARVMGEVTADMRRDAL